MFRSIIFCFKAAGLDSQLGTPSWEKSTPDFGKECRDKNSEPMQKEKIAKKHIQLSFILRGKRTSEQDV